MKLNAQRTGFTLVEFLLVLGLLGIIFTITLQMISPSSQLDKANAVKRKAHIREIRNAAVQYMLDGNDLAALPTTGATATAICKQSYTGTSCTSNANSYDLASQIVPAWLSEMPVDPVVERNDADNVLPAHDTGYRIWISGVYPEVCAYYGDEPC